MNYRPTLSGKGAGLYLAEGVRFHSRALAISSTSSIRRRTRLATDVVVDEDRRPGHGARGLLATPGAAR